MGNEENIKKLKEKIINTLTPLIDSDYALLEVPDYDNIGDNLIWQGEVDFLDKLDYKKKYECSYLFFEDKKIKDCKILLFQGGGNFGDLYEVVQNFRLKIINKYKDKKIIIFPQTIYYKNVENALSDSEIINSHPNLTICVRDENSFQFARKYFYNSSVLLLPDMAFCIDSVDFRIKQGSKKLIMKRNDKEVPENLSENLQNDYDILDWPSFNLSKEKRYQKLRINRALDKIALRLMKIPLLSSLVDSRNGIKFLNTRKKYVNEGVRFFSDYNEIHTTRLHGLILGTLMNRNMKILDNKYKKVSSFYNKWMQDFKDIEM